LVTSCEFWALFRRFAETDDEKEAAELGDQIISEVSQPYFESARFPPRSVAFGTESTDDARTALAFLREAPRRYLR
jgi:hypothetical protein